MWIDMIQIYGVKVFLEKHSICLRHDGLGSQVSTSWRQSLIYRLPMQTLATAQVMPHRVFVQNGPLVMIWP